MQSKDELFHKAEQLNQAVRQTEWKWEDDDNASACRNCKAEFSLLTRKHHCRSCGRIFCGSTAPCTSNITHAGTCSDHFVTSPGSSKPSRLCDGCFKIKTEK